MAPSKVTPGIPPKGLKLFPVMLIWLPTINTELICGGGVAASMTPATAIAKQIVRVTGLHCLSWLPSFRRVDGFEIGRHTGIDSFIGSTPSGTSGTSFVFDRGSRGYDWLITGFELMAAVYGSQFCFYHLAQRFILHRPAIKMPINEKARSSR